MSYLEKKCWQHFDNWQFFARWAKIQKIFMKNLKIALPSKLLVLEPKQRGHLFRGWTLNLGSHFLHFLSEWPEILILRKVWMLPWFPSFETKLPTIIMPVFIKSTSTLTIMIKFFKSIWKTFVRLGGID